MTGNQTGQTLNTTRAIGTRTPIVGFSQEHSILLRNKELLQFSDNHFHHQLMEETDDDQLRWYPMRLRYGRKARSLAVRDSLREKGYDTFLHLQTPPEEDFIWEDDAPIDRSLYSLIFVHATKIQLKLLKRFDQTCSIMQFMAVKPLDENRRTEIIWVPDLQMENFIHASTYADPRAQRIPLTYNDFINKQDRRVRIIHGPFKGIEGEVKRIQHHRIVVALIRNAHVAVGITHVPPEDMEFI